MERKLPVKILSKNNIEFTIDIGFDKFGLLSRYFGINEDTGDIRGCKYNHKTGQITFSTKMLPFIYDLFQELNLDTDCLNEIKAFNERHKNPFDISDKKYLYDYQYEWVKRINERPHGLIQAKTGSGKNVVISYLIENYKDKGNILLIAPTKAILDEIRQRAEAFNIDFGDRVKSIHAAGFMKSNYKDDESIKKWLNDVTLVLVDEAENVTMSIEAILRNYAPNYRYIIGFSATADRFNNKTLTYKNLRYSLQGLHTETLNLLYFFGTCLAVMKPDKSLVVYKTWLPIPSEPMLASWQQKQAVPKSVENVIFSEAFLQYIDFIEKNYGDKVLFIPVKTIKQGERILDFCNHRNYKAVLWQGKSITTTKNLENEDIKDYETLKHKANKHKVQIIISTSIGFKGIDIKAITDTLLVIGTNASTVLQIIGRSYRADEQIRVWMLFNDTDRYVSYADRHLAATPIFNACNNARLRVIKEANKNGNLRIETMDINTGKSDKDNDNFVVDKSQSVIETLIRKNKARRS